MDYSRVPGGAQALIRLQEEHPDIHLNYDAALELYTMYGAYSKVQAALTQLFGRSENPQPDAVQRLQASPSEDWSSKPNNQREQSRTVTTRSNSSSQRDLTPGGYGMDDTGQREGATPQLTWPPEEDSLLFVDADMFQYLQKYCREDYQQILSQHGVEVVEVTNQGFTSLYLHSVGEGAQHQKSLSLARNAISRFFQENEQNICRGEFLKSWFSSGKDLETAKDNLRLRHAKILLKEDNTNVYMIGRSKDVRDAKQFLLEQSLEQVVKSEEGETKDDVARRVRLAPRFKESGLSPLGSRPTDFCLRGGLTAQSRPKPSGPMLGVNVLSEPALSSEKVPRASPHHMAEDTPFKSQTSLSLTASLQRNNTSFHSDVIKSPPKTASPSTSLQDRTPVPLARSGSSLRRTNSFSGTPQRKAQLTQQRSQDDTKEFPAGARSLSSFPSDHPSEDRQAGHVAEMVVSLLMWQHIKEAYAAQVDDLTSDVQTKESTHGGSNSVTITLRGASPSTLQTCRVGLQRLIDSVDGDLSAHKLTLSELGLTDPADETLLACCNNVRNSFRKVTIQITKENVLIVGPSLTCSQVAASLRGVFLTDLTQTSRQQESSVPYTHNSNTETLVQSSDDQRAKRNSPSKKDPRPESSRGTTDGTGIGQEKTEQVNGSVSQPRRSRDPVIKEKVKYAGTGDRNGQRSSVFVSEIGDKESKNDKPATRPDEDTPRSVKESLDSAQRNSGHQRHKESDESRSSTLAEPLQRGICGHLVISKLDITILGHKKDSAIKITYYIPDGIQEVRNCLYTDLIHF